MKNTSFKIISLLLAIIFASGIFAGCGGGGSDAVASGTAEATTAAEETTAAETELTDNLPEKDFGGRDFKVLIRTEWAYEFKITEETGDVVNDAVLQRNRAVEDRFNAVLNFIDIAGSWNANAAFTNTVKSSIMAGDGAYDMVASYQAYMVSPAIEGYFHNLLTIPYLDFEKPWWSKLANDTLTVDGCLYLATGDITLTFWENLYVNLYNKALAEKYQIGDLNKLVLDGGWTVDKEYEITSKVSGDVDGDGVLGAADLYGLATPGGNHLRAYLVTNVCPITEMDDTGYPVLCFNSERTLNVVEKASRLHWADSTFRKCSEVGEPIASGTPVIFAEDRALILDCFLGQVSVLRDMDTDFGVIPRAKFDESQDSYYTTPHNSVTMLCFPITFTDLEFGGILTEALCAASYDTVKPAFYEVALKTKYARDTDSEAMIDLIRDSIMFDFGWVHSVPMNSIGTLLQSVLEASSTPDFASKYADQETKFEEGLVKIRDAYANAQK